ncbi:MAG: cupin domain-containing protein [Pseudomonadota bacterium]
MQDDYRADEIRQMLNMKPHPEGGWYAETFRDEAGNGGRSHSTAIYFLLEGGDVSHWHRVTDAVEVWHHYAGAPMVITLSPNGHDAQAHRLGTNFGIGERPQVIVPANWWQTAASLGHWTLVGCTVSPGFEFSSFELAEPDWRPVPRQAGS